MERSIGEGKRLSRSVGGRGGRRMMEKKIKKNRKSDAHGK